MHRILLRSCGVYWEIQVLLQLFHSLLFETFKVQKNIQFLSTENAHDYIAFGLNQRPNPGNHYEGRKNNKTIRRKNAK
jgi:hypothetical protein